MRPTLLEVREEYKQRGEEQKRGGGKY